VSVLREFPDEDRRDGVFTPLSSVAAPPPFLPFISTWSLPNGFGSGDMDPSPALPQEFGTHQVSFQPLGEDCGLFQANVQFDRQVRITGTVASERPFLLLRLPQAGRVRIGLHGDEALTETPEGYGLFLHGRVGDQCDIEQNPNEASNVVAPMISVDRLRSMLAGMRVPTVIERFIDGHGDNFVASPKMSAAMRRLGHQLNTCPYTGDLGNLYRQGKLFEVVAGVLDDLDDRLQPRRPTVGAERSTVAAVCDLLLADLAHPPTLEVLARGVGLPQRRLAEIFRTVTGLTVVEWVLRQKLAQAADLLREGRLPVKEIAWRLGYSQVSTFTAAFTRQFGVPPAGYRRTVVSKHAVVGAGWGE
jgi:AraC-like DNA-binding protein